MTEEAHEVLLFVSSLPAFLGSSASVTGMFGPFVELDLTKISPLTWNPQCLFG